jgi:hypothetical protein
MARIAYTGKNEDGSEFGGLFESDMAERFEGNESDTGDEYDYSLPEELYLTDAGSWILNQATVANPDRNTYTALSPDEARAWLEANNHPEAAKRYFRPRGGRPNIGERLITTAPARMIAQIADLAEEYDEDIPDTVRRLLREALTHRETIGILGGDGPTAGEVDAASRKAQHDALIELVREFGGTWDPERVITGLFSKGHMSVNKKRARRILRDVAERGLLVKVQDRPVLYNSPGLEHVTDR